jgi:hypothetical protein
MPITEGPLVRRVSSQSEAAWHDILILHHQEKPFRAPAGTEEQSARENRK